MEGFNQDTSLKKYELNDDSAFSPSTGSSGENELDILHLFGKEKLENIQQSLSKFTGLAFVTVDYRGEPITESTRFSDFCSMARSDSRLSLRCKSSDAFGSIQAAVMQKPSVYFCPCGLLEVAIPIVVRGHYLGGFIGGQVRCLDAPEDISRLEKVMSTAEVIEVIEENRHFMENIPVYPFENFMDSANLVFLIINQLGENKLNLQMQREKYQKVVKKLCAYNDKQADEVKQKELKILELEAAQDISSVLDTLISLVNLTVIEDAPRTGEVLNQLIDYVKYASMESGTYVSVSRELEQAERFLAIQKHKLGERLNYSIRVPKNLTMQRIPSDVLLPFVKSAVYYGVMMKRDGGEVTIKGYISGGRCVLEVEDNGLGMSEEELQINFEAFSDRHEGYYIGRGKDHAQLKMKKFFGDSSEILIESSKGKGRRTLICWPENFSERMI